MSGHVVLVQQQPLLADSDLARCAAGLPGVRWERVAWRDETPPTLDRSRPDVVLLELSGIAERARALLHWLERAAPATSALGLLPGSTDEDVLGAAASALDDFLLWPAPRPELNARLARLLSRPRRDARSVQMRLTAEVGLRNLVGEDAGFLAIMAKVPRIAEADENVLITGETGTGKELFARAIHHLSARRAAPFIAIDGGALPEGLFENELFGHAAGAFTDARAAHRGLAALAEGGVLFFDEIDALSPGLQSKLLRFLEDRTYKPLGSEQFRTADIRVVAATNRNLEALVGIGGFRRDLYFRLNVLHLRLPPLRERPGDISVLAQHFLETQAMRRGQSRTLAPSALRKLVRHHWPGNVRELLNAIQRAVVFAHGPVIRGQDIELTQSLDDGAATTSGFREARADALARFERSFVEDLLRKHSGNITRAAREARKDRRAFGRLVKRLGLSNGPPPRD